MSAQRSSIARVDRADLADALEHASEQVDRELRLDDFDVSQPEQIAIASIPDDLSSWPEWRPRELRDDFDDEERFFELVSFRGRPWAERASRWTPATMPPIVLVETSEYEGVSDGRGRVSYAIGMGWPTVPAVRMVERKRTAYNMNARDLVVRAARKAKVSATSKLVAFGISDRYTVKVRPLGVANALGQYRSLSQFQSGPIFWLSDRLDEQRISEGVKAPLEQIIEDTILHEYGHVVWEFARLRDERLMQLILDIENDEEEFAETFALTVRRCAVSPAYRAIAAAYQRALSCEHVHE